MHNPKYSFHEDNEEHEDEDDQSCFTLAPEKKPPPYRKPATGLKAGATFHPRKNEGKRFPAKSETPVNDDKRPFGNGTHPLDKCSRYKALRPVE
jgi:hypothetical protein